MTVVIQMVRRNIRNRPDHKILDQATESSSTGMSDLVTEAIKHFATVETAIMW